MKKPSKHLNTIKVRSDKKLLDSETVKMPYPEEVMIVISQYPGDNSEPIVEVGSYVAKGQRIAEDKDSLAVHSSVSGTVTGITEIRVAGEDRRTAIVIESDDKDKISEYIEVPVVDTKKTLLNWLKRGGITNRTAPLYELLERDDIEELYIDATEYEPVVTSSYRCLMEDTDDIINGVYMIVKHLELPYARICIEENRIEAIERVQKAIDESGHSSRMVIKPVTSRYVQQNSKIKIYEMTGKTPEQQPNALFIDVVASANAGNFLKTGVPNITRKVTVGGDIVKEPKNVEVPIGTHIADVIDFCGGYIQTPRKILTGGTMSGKTVASDRVPVMKDTDAIIAFEGKTAVAVEKEARRCINCRECFLGCPIGLYPQHIEKAVENQNIKMLRKLNANKCIQCGSCTYICPAKRPLMKSCAKAISMLREEN